MSRAPDKAYRATDPAAVEASLERYNQQRDTFFDAVKAYGRELGHEIAILGDSRRLFANHLLGTWRRDGMYERPKDGKTWEMEKVADIPSGWHFYVKDSEVRPYRGGRDKASKAAVARIHELNKQSPGGLGAWLQRDFGIQAGTPFFNFGFEPVGDTFFVITAEPPPGSFRLSAEWDGNEHFEPVPMSTYWLAKETDEPTEEAG